MAAIDDVISSARDVKNALISKWIEDGCFKDCNKMQTGGVMAESVGLTSVMLMSTCFNDAQSFWDEGDRKKLEKIVTVSVGKIYDHIMEKGFTASPVVPENDRNNRFFSKDNGYTDTVTWVMSSMVLSRYSQRKRSIELEPDTKKKIFELLALSIRHVVSSEEDGRWGFMTSKDKGKELGEPNVYHTYCMSASIADFFDYIAGEINDVESLNEDRMMKDYRDEELISYLDSELGYDVVDTLDKIRERTGWWLLTKCLPALPDIAACNVQDDLYDKLGIWKPGSGDYSSYLHLYYAFFIIDMLAMNKSDILFNEVIESRREELAEIYDIELTNKVDNNYFFNSAEPRTKEDLFENFYKGYIEQAIQLSKNKFMEASRTGEFFWDTSDSELDIIWRPKDANLQQYAQMVNSKHYVTEPTLIPMSLRSIIDFCYYISNQPDFSVDKRYVNTMDSMSEVTDENHVKNLWDDQNYNLFVTERSIESMIDYYDYVNRFYKNGTAEEVISVASVSELERLINEMIDKRIELKAPSLAVKKAPKAATAEPTADDIIEKLVERVYGDLMSCEDICDSYTKDDYLYKLLEISSKLADERTLKRYRELVKDNISSEDRCKRVRAFNYQWGKLFVKLMDEVGKTSPSDWAEMYKKYREY